MRKMVPNKLCPRDAGLGDSYKEQPLASDFCPRRESERPQIYLFIGLFFVALGYFAVVSRMRGFVVIFVPQ